MHFLPIDLHHHYDAQCRELGLLVKRVFIIFSSVTLHIPCSMTSLGFSVARKWHKIIFLAINTGGICSHRTISVVTKHNFIANPKQITSIAHTNKKRLNLGITNRTLLGEILIGFRWSSK